MKIDCIGFAAASLLVVLSCSEAYDSPISVSGLENQMIFTSEVQHSKTFKVSAGCPWRITKSDLDWLVVSPMEGDGSEDVTVYVLPQENEDAQGRKGTLKLESDCGFKGDAGTESLVAQYPAGVTTSRQFFGLTGTSIELATEGNPFDFKFFSTADWEIDTDQLPSWVSVSPMKGNSFDITEISIVPEQNVEDRMREGKLVLKVKGSSPITLTLTQKTLPKEDILLGWWTIGDNDFLTDWNKSHGNCWLGDGFIPADRPEGTRTKAVWHCAREEKPTYIISSDGNGHWAVKPVWEGDYMEFIIPAAEISPMLLKPGMRLRLRFAMSGVATLAKYWNVEVYENDRWNVVSPREFTTSKSAKVTATYALQASSTAYDVDVTAVLSGTPGNEIRLRITPVEPTYTVGGSVVSTYSSGTTIRLRPASSFGEMNDAISIYLAR